MPPDLARLTRGGLGVTIQFVQHSTHTGEIGGSAVAVAGSGDAAARSGGHTPVQSVSVGGVVHGVSGSAVPPLTAVKRPGPVVSN
jgi:hypothetical protein